MNKYDKENEIDDEVVHVVPKVAHVKNIIAIPFIGWRGMVSWYEDQCPRLTHVYEVPECISLHPPAVCLGKVDDTTVQLSVNNVENVMIDIGVIEFCFIHDIALWTCDCENDLSIEFRLWQRNSCTHAMLFLETRHTNGDRELFWEFYDDFMERLFREENCLDEYA